MAPCTIRWSFVSEGGNPLRSPIVPASYAPRWFGKNQRGGDVGAGAAVMKRFRAERARLYGAVALDDHVRTSLLRVAEHLHAAAQTDVPAGQRDALYAQLQAFCARVERVLAV